ncbi:unnamed protein product [Lupinus luteus]|uniref:Uncharacterized protein n=1 Tax=Lupinus luteus TaxID=3873 RepID=A0AAV1XJW4_LUPLU
MIGVKGTFLKKLKSIKPIESLKEDLVLQVKASDGQIRWSEIDVLSFGHPDLNSGSLFDPNLLAAFEQAVKENVRMAEELRRARVEAEASRKPCSIEENIDDNDPMVSFEEKCTPGGDSAVIFYTTMLTGI